MSHGIVYGENAKNSQPRKLHFAAHFLVLVAVLMILAVPRNLVHVLCGVRPPHDRPFYI